MAYFLLDILHYFVGAWVNRCWIQHRERVNQKERCSLEGDYTRPVWLGRPAWFFFNLKILALLAGFGAIAWHVATTI
ncbi:MAG: hypothetical protein WD960_03670 [Gemmatimonadota bacterium]